MSRYAPHERLVASARPHSELGRVFFGVFVIGLGFLMAVNPLTLAGAAMAGLTSEEFQLGDRPGPLLYSLFLSGIMGLMVFLVSSSLHGRTALQITGPLVPGTWELHRSFTAFIVATIAISILVPNGSAPPVDVTMTSFSGWLIILPLSLLAILVQAGSEEILFRGYLQQHLAARFSDPVVWMGVTNILFALAHIHTIDSLAEGWTTLVILFAIGMAASDLVARSGSLFPAIGLHLANNAWALLLFRPEGGPYSGLALYRLQQPAGEAEAFTLSPGVMMVELGALFCVWLAVRIAIRR